jgi:signal transduction histidine kinase/CheY-like chemotaxis protein
MLWLYITDACLSCVGLLIAASAMDRPGLVLLALPVVGLMALLARERQQRLEYSLALTSAYRRTTTLLVQSQSLTQELQTQSGELQRTNQELQEKARLLAAQNRDIELKNEEIELARRGLEEKAAQLALSSKYKSEFLANVSHELRTPLNSMLLLSRLLAENPDGILRDREIEFAGTIHAAGNDLLSLINDILDLSKVEAGRMELDLADVALSDVCADVERSFRPLANEKGLSFAIELDPALPPSIVSDRQRLGQVLKNLLSNAFKFTHEGGVRLSLGYPADGTELRNDALRGAGQVIVFSVTDTGVGIPDDKLNLIFEAFQQADGSTSRKYGGTGLGLSISREIARLLGGEIQVESVLSLGSRFSLLIPSTPRVASRADEPTPAERVGAPAARSDELRVADDRDRIGPEDRTVLVIDSDTSRVRAMLEVVHARGEMALVAAETGAALELAREHQPAAVLLAGDAKRVEAGLAELKQQPDTRHLPVVAIGGLAARLPTLRLGAAAFVERSVATDDLIAALARVEELAATHERRVALLADPAGDGELARVLRSLDVEVVLVDAGEGTIALRAAPYDLAVMAIDGLQVHTFATLRELVTDEALRDLPLIAYVPGELTKLQRARLDALAKAAVIAIVDSPERLADRATLFLHRAQATLPTSMRTMLDRLTVGDAPLHGKKVLVIDDDIRSGFALTSMLEVHGMKSSTPRTAAKGLSASGSTRTPISCCSTS